MLSGGSAVVVLAAALRPACGSSAPWDGGDSAAGDTVSNTACEHAQACAAALGLVPDFDRIAGVEIPMEQAVLDWYNSLEPFDSQYDFGGDDDKADGRTDDDGACTCCAVR